MKFIQMTRSPSHEIPCRPIHLFLGISAAVFLGGCGLLRPHDDPTRFYVLTVPQVATQRLADTGFKRLKIVLKPVELPTYLRSKLMVVRTGTNEIHFAEFERWAEPLDQGIGRVMKDTLSSARNVESATLNSHGDDTSNCEVAIRILACEGVRLVNGTSSVRFAATWQVRGLGTNSLATRLGGFTTDTMVWNGKDYGQLAERLSEAIAGASTALATDLRGDAVPSLKTTPETTTP